jgi:aspartate racemase
MKKTIGILGGMGPRATIYLFDRIIQLTRAEKDSDHIPIIVYNNPKIPDRTESILHGGPSSLPFLIDGAKLLEKAGADLIIMPCITAHYYYPEIIKHIKIPFLHALEATALHIKTKLPALKKVGLLSTTGTIESGIFQDQMEKEGLEVVIPDEEYRFKIMDAIYENDGIKAGFIEQPKKILLEVVSHLIEGKGSQAIIAGCTEIPLVLKPGDFACPLIDPLKIIALRSIEEAGYLCVTTKTD